MPLRLFVILSVVLGAARVRADAASFEIRAYPAHVEIEWPEGAPVSRIERVDRAGGTTEIYPSGLVGGQKLPIVSDYIGRGKSAEYRLTVRGRRFVRKVSTREVSDSELLDMVQRATLRYFWLASEPVSGMARERTPSGPLITTGGSGFGMMALLVGIERGFIAEDAASERLLRMLRWLEKAEKFNGVFPHWMNGPSGKTVSFSAKDDGADLVETAFLAQGLLTVREYFRGRQSSPSARAIVDTADRLWRGINWRHHYRVDNGKPTLYWHWSPSRQFGMNYWVIGPNETLVTFVLAMASPTYSIPPDSYAIYSSPPHFYNGNSYFGYPLAIGWPYGGPLFFTQFSFLGLDPRRFSDPRAGPYFEINRNHTLINYEWCRRRYQGRLGTFDFPWGLSASDSPSGYKVHEPTEARDDGTFTPTAALSAFPYTPAESLRALKLFYFEYGDRLWGPLGFRDAFNPQQSWFATDELAIDQGPIVVMIENHRTGLLWNLFMNAPEIRALRLHH